MDTPITTTQSLPDIEPDPSQRDLRSDFVQAYGGRVFLALSIVGALFLLPFTVSNLLHGRTVVGTATAMVAVFLIANAAAVSRGRELPFRTLFIFGPILVALAVGMYEQGLVGILWSYAALLLFHFVLPRRTANVFNGLVILLAVPLAWMHLGPEVTARVGVTLVLTLLFTNIFSYVADAQRRKEMEQRHRLDLLVRGTNAGSMEWEADGRVQYSKRLKQMLGRGFDEDTREWDFFELVHPDDRERVRAVVMSELRSRGTPNRVRHLPPDDYRMLRPDGSIVWVHTEGISVTDARGRTARYICSFMDISERVQAQEALVRSAAQLEAQNAALREAIRMREEVERIARHDLKTPLASIASVPRLLRQARTLAPDEEELLGMVERAALRVLSMVNLSLDLYRMEEGTYRLRAQPVDLAALLHTVAREVRAHADSKHVELDVPLPGRPLFAEGEELLCYSIIANLVKNAVEASPEGDSVRITAGRAHVDGVEAVVVRIRNAGPVPLAVRQRFFEKYATHGKAGGTGLGAYSARLMARVQRGDLHMQTDPRGTTLTLWLRAGVRATQGAPAGVPDAAADAAVPVTALPPLSVLVVDDDEYNVMVLRGLLPVAASAVSLAVNGRDAIQKIAQSRPDVVFLDLQMPVMGGLEAIARIRKLQLARGQPPSMVIAFSARDDDESRRQCLEAGFDHYLVKPASREELLAVLRRVEPSLGAPAPADRLVAADGDLGGLDAIDDEVRALLPEFIASRRQKLAELREAIDRADRDAVHLLAHTLAGSLAMYGFRAASTLAREIERAARTETPPWLRERCTGLVDRFEREQAALTAATVPA